MTERRNDDRVRVNITGSMCSDDYLTSAVTVRDISASGCLVSCASVPRVGSRIQLRLSASATIPAAVMWSTVTQAGLWFPAGLPSIEMRYLRTKQRVA